MGDWIELLHQNIKVECGRGWLVTPQGRKTKVWRRLAKGLGANNPRSCCNLDIPFKQENAPLIRDTVKRLNDLTRNADNPLSLKEAQAKIETKSPVQAGVVNWENLKDEYLATRKAKGIRATTDYDTSRRLSNLLRTLSGKPTPRSGREAMIQYSKQHWAKARIGGTERKKSLQNVAAFFTYWIDQRVLDNDWKPLTPEQREDLIGVEEVTLDEKLTPAVYPKDLANLLDKMKEDGRGDLYLATALIGLYGLRLSELAAIIFEDDRPKVIDIKRSKKGTKKKPRDISPLDIHGREGEGARVMHMYKTGLEKLPYAVRTQIDRVEEKGFYKNVGDAYSGILERYKPWNELVAANKSITPYSLRHSFAYGAHHGAERTITRETAAKLMGHSVTVHSNIYSAWLDSETMDAEVKRFNASLIER